jgi:Tc toxin complex TcA C-terminal TcB-binding domain/Neuraminidase-like domain
MARKGKKKKMVYGIAGRIGNLQGHPLAGLTVRSYVRMSTGAEQVVRETATDARGAYRIEWQEDATEDQTPVRTLLIRILAGEHAIGSTEPQEIGEGETEVNLDLDHPVDAPSDEHEREHGDRNGDDDGDGDDGHGSGNGDPNDPWLRVHGAIRDQYGDPLDGVTVLAFDRALRTERLIGTTTAHQGTYEIRYRRSQLQQSDKTAADLVLKVLGTDGKELYQTPIQYEAPADLQLDVSLQGAIYLGPSEWVVMTSALMPLLEGVSPVDLREDDQYQDVSFLAGETGYSRLLLATWIACFQLADTTAREQTPLAPEVFYGFLRQGQPSIFYDSLLVDMKDPARRALHEDQTLQRLTELTSDLQRSVLEKALSANLIPARIAAEVDAILEMLQRIKLTYTASTTFGGGKGTVGQLLDITPAAKPQQAAFLAAFAANTGSLDAFWKKLGDEQVLPAPVLQQVRLSFELGALTRNHIPLVAELAGQFQSGALKAKSDLARFSHDDWKAIFARPGPDGKPIGVPANIDGATEDARREQYATILDQQFERAYPTTSFAAKLQGVQQSPVAARGDLVLFLNNNPGFHLDNIRVDHYLAENVGALAGIQDPAALIPQLKSVQRVFKLNPTHQAVDALLSRGIDSAQQVYFMGQGQLATALANSSLNRIEANRIYYRAANAYALALATFASFNQAVNGVTPHGVPSSAPDLATQAKIAALPNLQTLFGSLDYCECTHCRSVYSPASYFVDVLRFLGERGTQGTGVNAGKNVRQVLLGRRPDLGEIELSCENTETPLPYVDLVNEILEDVVAPPVPIVLSDTIEADLVEGPMGAAVAAELAAKAVAIAPDAHIFSPDSRGQWLIRDSQHAYKVFKTGANLNLQPTHQTFGSAAELLANPQYTNGAAYDRLSQEVFPLNLPFDLWYIQSRAYLTNLGVPQPQLFELFQQRLADDVTLAPSALQIDCAWLDLTETERLILIDALPGKQPWDYWGLAETGNDLPNPDNPADPTANIQGGWIVVLSHVPVMLNRAGVAYSELLQLLDMQYIDPAGSVRIADNPENPNAANCDTSQFIILGLTADVLGRIHRFIRLWRKLGCAMWDLDLLLPDTHPAPNVIDKRITDSVLQDISHLSRLGERFGLDWPTLMSLCAGIDDSQYVDRGQEGAPAVPSLYQRLFRNRLVDAVAKFPLHPGQITGSVADEVPGILAALRVKEADLGLILTDLGLATSANLDLGVLSHIHRLTVLAQALGLNIDATLRLKRLWAQDPFANPSSLSDFVELAGKVAASEFSVPELDYLLAHHFTPSSGVALNDKAIVTLMNAIRQNMLKIADDVQLKAQESKSDYVKSKLGQLPKLAKDADQVTAYALIDGTWSGSTPSRNALLDAFFVGVLDPATAHTNLAAIPGGLTPADQQKAVDQRFDYVQPILEAFLLQVQKEALIRQKAAEALQIDVPSATLLLDQLQLPADPTLLLQVLNDLHLLDLLPDGTFKLDLTEVNFPAVFKALRLLHENAMMIGKLRMSATEVAWWLEGSHAADMGWMHPKDFPIDTSTSLALGQWLAIDQFFAWKGGLPKSDLTAFDFATNLVDAALSSSSNLADLARLTAWDPDALSALVVAFHWLDTGAAFDVVKQRLRGSANLLRLSDCMRALRRLGVNANRAIGWAIAEPTGIVADSLKQAVKAKYELPQWLQVIQPLQDAFRDGKRAALASWLVAHPDQAQGQGWSDTDGLYSYFLIDVEMDACMLTSRLKQAAASAQLFVQRCLLNLEVDILASADLDPKWKQWQWMRRYRVWEANRKVFLYPENWIEPELRDEKSSFFQDLEQELLQNDITTSTAEDAYANYLDKLEKVANLEVRAIFDESIGGAESRLHVFGRTRSSKGAQQYHRVRVNNARWLPWEKVELEIEADHLLAGIHNRRLYLLWPQFLNKAEAPASVDTPNVSSSTPIVTPAKYWEIRMFWSELKRGKWTPKVLSDTFAKLYESDSGDNADNIQLRVRLAPYIEAWMYVSSDPGSVSPTSVGEFDKIGRQITMPASTGIEHLISGPQSRFAHNLMQHTTTSQYFYYNSVLETGKGHQLQPHENAPSIRLLQQINPTNTYSVIDSQAQAFASNGTFLTIDPHHVYHVDYSWRTEFSYYSHAWHSRQISAFQFFIHYHPFVELFIKELNIWGVKGLLNRRIQVDPASVPGSPAVFNFADYQPDFANVVNPLPVEDVDFTANGAYSPYNWELFFHVPCLIANRLSTNQRFEEALAWYHYIFDPTSTDNVVANPDTPQQKFWITKPFYETTKADYYKQKIENMMLAIAQGDAQLRDQVDQWRDNPFNPHLIARMRTVAYQKNVLIKYIQTLIAWGDQLFGQDTIESINEATQLYILAAVVLGPRPRSVPRDVANPVRTFYQLQQEGIDAFGNALKEVENLLPQVQATNTLGSDAPELPFIDVLYFCIPNNEKLLTLWDTVADRLFKIRHCMNIQGVVRQLPLFEPPIDPALLVQAAAAGVDIGSVLSDLSAPLPLYRFTFVVQRALEICTEVKALGAAMLASLEKRDVEGMARLRSSHERTMLDLVQLVKDKQVDEALSNKEALDESRKVTDQRRAHYQQLIDGGWNDWEKGWLGLTLGAIYLEGAGIALAGIGAALAIIPDLDGGVAGFGASPTVKIKFGGKNIYLSVNGAADVVKGLGTIAQMSAGMTSTIGSYNRRAEDWDLQKQLAELELPQIDKQIAAADIRHQVAIQEQSNQKQLIANAQAEDDYLHTKFTNQELYDWMVSQISTVYFQSYQLAFDVAKRAERCFRYELGLSDSNYIRFGYWNSLRNGLVCGESLYYDLKRLETAYYEQNRREYELTKHVSLAQLDPIALLKLRQNGECLLDIPEAAFDMDYPGQYFRRVKTVELSIPCTAGPYTTIACTLTMTSNHLRQDATLLAGKYARDTTIDDPRFRDEIGAVQSVATSSAQNDSGLFELTFHDDRYLPFEGAGAISSWHLKLNRTLPQFDFATISDVIIHLRYTAREGGDLLGSTAALELNQKLNQIALAESRSGLFRVFDLKREYPDKWYHFLHPAAPADDQAIVLDDLPERLPYFTRGFTTKKARQIEVVAHMKDNANYKVQLSPLGTTPADLLLLAPDPTYLGLDRALKDLTGAEIDLAAWTLKLQADGAADFKSLPADAIDELFLIVNYTIA